VSPGGVGVLALQGDAGAHAAALERLGVRPRGVRRRADLAGLTHLVLPGGESTTLAHLIDLFDLRDELQRRVRGGSLAVLGTCAGAILLGRGSGPPRRLELLDADLVRNAYGRQVDSFAGEVALVGDPAPLRGVFIRAPRIERVGSEVEVLGHRTGRAGAPGEPVLLRSGNLVAATFHPELTDDPRVHAAFLALRPEHPPADRALHGSATA